MGFPDRFALEFARPLLWPALDHHFFVRVELDGIAPLAVQRAEKAVFPPAEWEIRHGRGYPDVNADISRRRVVAEATRGSAAGGKDRGCISVCAAREDFNGLIYGIGVDQAQHRP